MGVKVSKYLGVILIKKALFLLTSSMLLSACTTLSSDNWWHTDQLQQSQENQNGAYRQAPSKQRPDNMVDASRRDTMTRAEKITANIVREGQLALSDNRLLTPEGDNANLYFQIALGRDPGNYEATLGIAAIVDKYLAWALEKVQKEDFKGAKELIALARQVNPRDPKIDEIEGRIEQQQHLIQDRTAQQVKRVESDNLFYLPDNLFQLSEERILTQIQPIIDRVEHTKGSIEINWPSDKDGRLLYQIINSRTPNFRVRAMIFHSSKHTIEVLVN